MHEVWCQFLEYLRHTNGDLSAFWMSYIQLVGDVLLGLIQASREGNWQLHLFAIRQMIPWCFAYDKMNYARYLPPYYAQMTTLEVDHPEVYQSFMEGQFSVQLAGDNPFGRLPVDQTTEVTVNKDTKIAVLRQHQFQTISEMWKPNPHKVGRHWPNRLYSRRSCVQGPYWLARIHRL